MWYGIVDVTEHAAGRFRQVCNFLYHLLFIFMYLSILGYIQLWVGVSQIVSLRLARVNPGYWSDLLWVLEAACSAWRFSCYEPQIRPQVVSIRFARANPGYWSNWLWALEPACPARYFSGCEPQICPQVVSLEFTRSNPGY